jgi:hypothetical protein
MSAGLREHDKIQTRADLGVSWHGQDELVPEVTFANSPADFSIIEKPAEFSMGAVTAEEIAAALETNKFRSLKKDAVAPLLESIMGKRGIFEDGKIIVNERTGRAISMVNSRYGVIQNSPLFEAIMKALNGVPVKVNSIMTLDNQAKIVFALDISQNGNVAKDEFRDNLTVVNSFDGSWSATLFDSSTRVVCQNTLNLAHAENHGIELSVRHNNGADIRIENMALELETIFARRREFYANLNRIASVEMNPEMAIRVLWGMFSSNKLSTRGVNMSNNIASLFDGSSKLGIEIDGQTRYGLFNAVTQYFTRYSSDTSEGMRDNKTAKQWSQSEYGQGAKHKANAYEILIDDEKLNAMAEKGQRLYEQYERDHKVDAPAPAVG